MKIRVLLDSLLTPQVDVDVEEELEVDADTFRSLADFDKVVLLINWANEQGIEFNTILGYTELKD